MKVNNITTLFFATLRDPCGVKSIEMQIPAQTNVAEFKSMLVEKIPALNGLISQILVSV